MAAVNFATAAVRYVDDVVLIGEPAGQPPNFFVGFAIPNHATTVHFAITNEWVYMWPGYEHNAMMPDIFIQSLFYDFINGRDAVIEYIRAGYGDR